MNENLIPAETENSATVVSATSTLTPAAVAAMDFKGEVLTAEELAKVAEIVSQIKIDDDVYVAGFGAEAQDGIAKFSMQALDGKRVYETGQSSQDLVRMFSTHLSEFKQLEQPKGIAAVAEKLMGEIKWWLKKYEKITKFVNEAKEEFQKQANELTVDKNVNKEAYQVNLRNRRDLLVYLKAGYEALEIARTGKLVELQRMADESKAPTDIENARNFSKMCDEFNTKLGRISCSLAITYVREPEINLLLESERRSIALFNDLITQAIPLWLDQMRTALNIKNINQANETADAARAVTEGLFMNNVEQVGQAGLQTVRTASDGIIRTEVITAGTDKLLAALVQVDAACKDAIAKGEQYERDHDATRQKIVEFQKNSMK